MRESAEHLKGLSMELGGKSPCLIFADAELDRAIDSALFPGLLLNGERCTAGSRLLVERSVYDSVVDQLAARAARVRVGDPADPVLRWSVRDPRLRDFWGNAVIPSWYFTAPPPAPSE